MSSRHPTLSHEIHYSIKKNLVFKHKLILFNLYYRHKDRIWPFFVIKIVVHAFVSEESLIDKKFSFTFLLADTGHFRNLPPFVNCLLLFVCFRMIFLAHWRLHSVSICFYKHWDVTNTYGSKRDHCWMSRTTVHTGCGKGRSTECLFLSLY